MVVVVEKQSEKIANFFWTTCSGFKDDFLRPYPVKVKFYPLYHYINSLFFTLGWAVRILKCKQSMVHHFLGCIDEKINWVIPIIRFWWLKIINIVCILVEPVKVVKFNIASSGHCLVSSSALPTGLSDSLNDANVDEESSQIVHSGRKNKINAHSFYKQCAFIFFFYPLWSVARNLWAKWIVGSCDSLRTFLWFKPYYCVQQSDQLLGN